MYRHIFMGRFKDGISEETKAKELADMKLMKEKIPGIVDQRVGFMTGWAGMTEGIAMTVDFATKEDFDVYMKHPYHKYYIDQTGRDYFQTDTFAVAQFEM